jgi:hypothetical protein
VDDRQGAGEIREEDDGRLQRGDEDRLTAAVVGRDGGSELADPSSEVLGREIDLADSRVQVGCYEARSSRYRCANRSMSRR